MLAGRHPAVSRKHPIPAWPLTSHHHSPAIRGAVGSPERSRIGIDNELPGLNELDHLRDRRHVVIGRYYYRHLFHRRVVGGCFRHRHILGIIRTGQLLRVLLRCCLRRFRELRDRARGVSNITRRVQVLRARPANRRDRGERSIGLRGRLRPRQRPDTRDPRNRQPGEKRDQNPQLDRNHIGHLGAHFVFSRERYQERCARFLTRANQSCGVARCFRGARGVTPLVSESFAHKILAGFQLSAFQRLTFLRCFRPVNQYTLLNPIIGGILIGFANLLATVLSGKIPGISGVFGRLLVPATPDKMWRVVFLLGLIGGAALSFQLWPAAALYRPLRPLAVMAIAGLLVGFGTRLGGGCTSGHGVCGVGMGAKDSIAATLTFMAVAMASRRGVGANTALPQHSAVVLQPQLPFRRIPPGWLKPQLPFRGILTACWNHDCPSAAFRWCVARSFCVPCRH